MVGMLVADKTPLKAKKQPKTIINKKRKNDKNDQTDSEEEENSKTALMNQNQKRRKRIIDDDDDDADVKIIFPKNLTFLKRFVKTISFFLAHTQTHFPTHTFALTH